MAKTSENENGNGSSLWQWRQPAEEKRSRKPSMKKRGNTSFKPGKPNEEANNEEERRKQQSITMANRK